MIQRFAKAGSLQAPRRGAVLLLAVLLNLALVPCTMALEVAEDAHHAHDCCPPEPQLDTSECCEVGVAGVATRGASTLPDDDGECAAPVAYTASATVAAWRYRPAADPPDDPPVSRRALYKLNCVYLK